MKKLLLVALCLALTLSSVAQSKVDKRISESTGVLANILDKPNGIPRSLLDKAACVLVYPNVKKVGVGVGVGYGRGVLVCRSGKAMDGNWGAPDASADAGPAGAQAVGFNDPKVDILTYSQSKGLFAGASLGSASMGADNVADQELYGKTVDAVEIIRGDVPVPATAKPLVETLNKVSPKHT